jgi:hypothetical protein
MFTPRSLLALLCGLLAAPAQADPGYYVVTPYPNEGQRVIELRYWTVARTGRPEMIWPELGARYGFNSRWTSGLLVSWIGESQKATRLSTLNWTNDFMLTQGEWPLDLALHTQWVRDRETGDRGAFEWGPALQTDFGRTQANLNLVFERGTGADRGKPTMLKYQWQLRHRWQPGLHFGAQGFGELGDWNDWDPHSRQSHRAGPALFGTVRAGDDQALQLSAAWLQGRTYRRSGHMLSLRAAAEF